MSVKRALGFESFMDNASEGWSIVAVRASIERVSMAIKRRDDVLEYQRNVRPLRLVGHPIIQVETGRRDVFLIQMEESPWTVLLRTVDWIRPEDAIAVCSLAHAISEQLGAVTIASVAAYQGAECRLFESGVEQIRIDTDDPNQDFLEFCDEHELGLPGCFIGCEDSVATLYIQDIPLNYVQRVDRLVMKAE